MEVIMLCELSDSLRVAGYKQTLRAIRQGRAIKVFIASDVDPLIFETVVKAAAQAGLPVEKTVMRELGKVCGIDVPTAVAAQIAKKSR
jgi:large subunit ribosomal protein L7A